MLDYGGTQALVFVIIFLFFIYFFVWLRPRNPPGLIKAVKSLSLSVKPITTIVLHGTILDATLTLALYTLKHASSMSRCSSSSTSTSWAVGAHAAAGEGQQ